MKPDYFKMISLNIELDRHFGKIFPFLRKENPDVILFQEVLEKDISLLEKMTGMKGVFAPQKILCLEAGESPLGMLTLSRFPILNHTITYFRGDGKYLERSPPGNPEKTARAILVTALTYQNQLYNIMNTHFTWTPDGKPSEAQHQDLKLLLDCLSHFSEFVLGGDFNAPRGGVIFDAIASTYQDNIPDNITTTIDKNLHKAGDLNLVVDGLFTTPGFLVGSVDVICNLSDHCAILATIKPKKNGL